MSTLVIGGGVAGISAAARLAPHGPVTLLEAEDALAYHASGRSAAAFLEDYGNATVRALNSASADHLRHKDGGVLSPRGLMLVAKEGEDAGFEDESATLGLSEIDLSSAEAKYPILDQSICKRAAYREDVYDLDTDLLIQRFLKDARAHGVKVETRVRVDRIRYEDGQWHVHAGDREWQCETLVNAAGAWGDEIARLAGVMPIGLVPRRRSMARISGPEGMDVSTWAFLHGVGETWYAKPDAGKLIVSPSEAEPVEPHDAWADDMVLAEGLARYESVVTQPVTRLVANWAGLRTFAPDKSLVIGRDAVRPEFVWCVGQGGYGFQTAPAAAQLLADRVLGRASELPTDIVAALSPERFQ